MASQNQAEKTKKPERLTARELAEKSGASPPILRKMHNLQVSYYLQREQVDRRAIVPIPYALSRIRNEKYHLNREPGLLYF